MLNDVKVVSLTEENSLQKQSDGQSHFTVK